MNIAIDALYEGVCDRGGLTRRQLLIWAGDRVAGGAPVFVEAARWHLHGPLDTARLVRAFDATVEAADALRMRIAEVEGWPVRLEEHAERPTVELVDLARHAAPTRALDDLAGERIWSCAPAKTLMAAVLARLALEQHVLLVVQHQLISDAWSFRLLHQRLAERYGRRGAAADAWPQFAEYVAHERSYRRSPRADEARRHWDRCRADGSAGGGTVSIATPAAMRVQRIVVPLGTKRSDAVRRLARETASADVGVFVVFAAAVAAHVHRTTGSDGVLLDVPFANRPSARFKATLGSFMNVGPVRAGVRGCDRWCDLRARLTAATWETARHQAFAGRGGGVPQPYDVLVNVHRSAVAASTFDACPMRVEWLAPTHRLGAASVAVHDFGATGEMTLVADLNETTFSPSDRAAFAASLLRLVDDQLTDSTRRLADAGRRPAERSVAGGAGATDGATVWTRFVAQAEATPTAIAVRHGHATATYETLWRGASEVAVRLSAAGAGRDTVVAVWGARGLGWVRALVGIWGCGAVYLPLDPSWPAARIADVLRRSGARFLVTDGPPPDVVWRLASADAGWTILVLDAARVALSASDPPVGPAAGDVAYVLYTSGSTGVPKGALVEHAGLLNHLDAKIALLALGPGDRVAQSAGAGFDVSLWQCLAPLLVGAVVEIVPDAAVCDPAELFALLAARRIAVVELVPTVLRLALEAEEAAAPNEEALASLRFVLVTGEALTPDLCRRWFARHPGIPLVNAYGPTECADDVTHHVLHAPPPADALRVPIGRPIPGMSVHVLDSSLEPVRDGEAGELCVSGIGVARGYLRDAERTAAAFVVRPIGSDGAPERLYRTGDRGRRLADGTLEWLGRLDAQVKIRGVRVEPAEVEAVLGMHPAVRQIAVVSRPGGDGAPRLVAYVVPASDEKDAQPVVDGCALRDVERLAEWERVWDDTYARESPRACAVELNTAGWHSRYTRRPIPEAEMRAWLEGTVARIRALAPRRVLEIGCGSGMVLRRLASACECWVATDLSAAAVDYVRAHHLAADGFAHVRVLQRAAHRLADLATLRPDVVVLNSVVQYFPSLVYLRAVLASVRTILDDRGAIFVGDVRSLPLVRMLHTEVELARASANCPIAELRARIERSIAQEAELLIDPTFFLELGDDPESTVDVELKPGRVHNELTCFRYDVTWRPGGARGADVDTELEWRTARPTVSEVRSLLAAHPQASLALRGVPNPRLQRGQRAVELVAEAPDGVVVGALRKGIAVCPVESTIDPEDLWALAGDGTHEVAIGWSGAGVDRYDVVFRSRCGGVRTGRRDVHGSGAACATSRPRANDPRMAAATAARVESLRAFVRARLPEAMVPGVFVTLQALPLSANGKVDHAALPSPPAGTSGGRDESTVSSLLECTVAAIWSRLLGVTEVGRDDEFFALGGDSLLVYRMLRALRAELGVELSVETFLAAPTVAATAGAIEAAHLEHLAADEAGILLDEVEALADDELAPLLRGEHEATAQQKETGDA